MTPIPSTIFAPPLSTSSPPSIHFGLRGQCPFILSLCYFVGFRCHLFSSFCRILYSRRYTATLVVFVFLFCYFLLSRDIASSAISTLIPRFSTKTGYSRSFVCPSLSSVFARLSCATCFINFRFRFSLSLKLEKLIKVKSDDFQF